ncbi:MAG: hypothetical protein GAK40_00532 [Burkholderia plantarii]|nr:MAG: hypothetical protein GAK40_00532 [Burkholderia plantarii]
MTRGKRAWPARQRGMAYLGVLILIAGVGLALTRAAQVSETARRRDNEAQLLFVGDQFRQAIERYYHSGGGSRYPATLAVLLDDRRAQNPLRHLRRLYADPMTGTTKWGIVKAHDGGVMGVFSEAPGRPIKRQGFAPRDESFDDQASYREWKFVYLPADAADAAAGGTVAPAGMLSSATGAARSAIGSATGHRRARLPFFASRFSFPAHRSPLTAHRSPLRPRTP